MHKKLLKAALAIVMTIFSYASFSQDYSFEDFVGTWHGNITSSYFGGYNDPMTMVIHSDGFYTETSGHLMPSLYHNTQQSEYLADTNRMHWWYISTVYSGQIFYAHHLYEVVYFQNDTLIMHYNYWNDPQPNPEAGAIFLVKENTNPPPENLFFDVIDGELLLTWDEPDNGGAPIDVLLGYNVYNNFDSEEFELLAFTEDTSFLVDNGATAGLNGYYVTAVYEENESVPSDQLFVVFETPEPDALMGDPQENKIELVWSNPGSEFGPRATLMGYNVFYKHENEEFMFLDYTESTNFTHEDLDSGTYHYFVTAVYDGGESNPSNEIEVSLATGTKGDANCDGVINLLDVVTIVNQVIGNAPDTFCFDNADVNNDGVVNILDVIGTVVLF